MPPMIAETSCLGGWGAITQQAGSEASLAGNLFACGSLRLTGGESARRMIPLSCQRSS